jgi:hypothetical protein
MQPLNLLAFFALLLPALADSFGGSDSIRVQASGWFRLEKMKNRLLFITPEGHGYLPIGLNHLRSFFNARAAGCDRWKKTS